jgi:hypothetical protein
MPVNEIKRIVQAKEDLKAKLESAGIEVGDKRISEYAGLIEPYEGSIENSTENAVIMANIERTKYRDYINYTIYNIGNFSLADTYEKVELKCQEYYSLIMGGNK